jgi:nicotinate-nucleotide adenylyltransferase
MTPLAISASLIRDLIGHGHSARYLLPDSVLDYIETHGLYR